MTISLKHAFTSAKSDDGDTTLVRPSNWNAEHTLTLAANKVLGAITAGAAVEIDCTAVGRTLLAAADAPAQALALGVATNANLLINGDFQINQRAFAGGSLAAAAYGFDRWCGGASGGTCTLSGYTLSLTAGAIKQTVETAAWGVDSLASTAITVSVDTPSADMTVTVGTVSGTITAGSGRRSVTITTAVGDTGNLPLVLAKASAGTVTFGRVKAALAGDTAWAPRSRAQETALAMRYFCSLPGSFFIDSYDSGPNAYYYAYFPFPTTMRATPTGSVTLGSSSNLHGSEPGGAGAISAAVGTLNIRGAAVGRMYGFFTDLKFTAEL